MSEKQNIVQDLACQMKDLAPKYTASQLFNDNTSLLWPGLGKRPARTYADLQKMTPNNYAIGVTS